MGVVRGYEGQLTTIVPNNISYNNPKIRDIYDELSIQDINKSCADEGVLSITTGLVGTLMASEAIKLILDIDHLLIGKLLLVDLLNIKFEIINYTSNE